MIDGTYNVALKIPFGAIRALVTLVSEGPVCMATVEANKETQRFEGTVDGDSFSFGGEVGTPLGKLAYDLTGTADGNTLSAAAKTKRGTFKISGTAA